eukprot:scaffold193230_cov18-Tisochrysis_lutea.AAC.1
MAAPFEQFSLLHLTQECSTTRCLVRSCGTGQQALPSSITSLLLESEAQASICEAIYRAHLVAHPDDLPPEVAAHILPDLQILVRAVQAATSCSGITVQQNNGSVAGQTVRQLHFHVIPCYSNPDATPSQHHPPTSNAHQQQQQQQSLSDPQGQGSLQLPESTAVCEEAEQGQLLADIRNRLPPSYSGEGCHVWVPSAEKMEQLGMHLQGLECRLVPSALHNERNALLQPGTVVLLSGQLGSGKTSIARGCIRAWCRDPHMHVPSPSFLLNLTYQQDRGYEQQNVEQQQQQQQSHHQAQSGSPGPQPAAVHHMDPF